MLKKVETSKVKLRYSQKHLYILLIQDTPYRN